MNKVVVGSRHPDNPAVSYIHHILLLQNVSSSSYILEQPNVVNVGCCRVSMGAASYNNAVLKMIYYICSVVCTGQVPVS